MRPPIPNPTKPHCFLTQRASRPIVRRPHRPPGRGQLRQSMGANPESLMAQMAQQALQYRALNHCATREARYSVMLASLVPLFPPGTRGRQAPQHCALLPPSLRTPAFPPSRASALIGLTWTLSPLSLPSLYMSGSLLCSLLQH